MNALPSRAAIALAVGTIYLVWGSTYLAIRVAVETMPPFLMASARFLVAGGLLLAFLKLRGSTPTAHQWRANTVIGGFLLLGCSLPIHREQASEDLRLWIDPPRLSRTRSRALRRWIQTQLSCVEKRLPPRLPQ